jgi:hypothetical protein
MNSVMHVLPECEVSVKNRLYELPNIVTADKYKKENGQLWILAISLIEAKGIKRNSRESMT